MTGTSDSKDKSSTRARPARSKKTRKAPGTRRAAAQRPAKQAPAAGTVTDEAVVKLRTELTEASRRELEFVRSQARHEVGRARSDFARYQHQWKAAFSTLLIAVSAVILFTWLIGIPLLARRAARKEFGRLQQPVPQAVLPAEFPALPEEDPVPTMEDPVPEPAQETSSPSQLASSPHEDYLARLARQVEKNMAVQQSLAVLNQRLIEARTGSRQAYDHIASSQDAPDEIVSGTARAAAAELRLLLEVYSDVPAKGGGLFGSRSPARKAPPERQVAMLHDTKISVEERLSVMREIGRGRPEVYVPLLVESLKGSESLFGSAAACGLLRHLSGIDDTDWLDFRGWINWWEERDSAEPPG